MLNNAPFYFGSIRKILVAFGSIFNDIHVTHADGAGVIQQTVKLPIAFGPKEKFIYRRAQDAEPNVDDQIEIVLPRASYNVISMVYDPARKLATIGRIASPATDNTQRYFQYNPVPYNIGLELVIATRNLADAWMIVEQILPFFSPDYTVTVKDIPQLQIEKDINFVLNSVSFAEDWEGDFTKVREIEFTLNFTAKAYIYPPVNTEHEITTAIITVSNVNFETLDINSPVVNKTTVTATIDPPTARKEDPHTIIDTITE